MYTVLEGFYDLQDARPCGLLAHVYHEYNVGDAYPRDGYEPTAERIRELSTDDNARGHALIAEVNTPARKRKGGGA